MTAWIFLSLCILLTRIGNSRVSPWLGTDININKTWPIDVMCLGFCQDIHWYVGFQRMLKLDTIFHKKCVAFSKILSNICNFLGTYRLNVLISFQNCLWNPWKYILWLTKSILKHFKTFQHQNISIYWDMTNQS